MRLLRIDDQTVDIDEQTAIGIDIQAYDISNPEYRRVSTSNNFTVPKTNNNHKIIGYAGNPQSISKKVYSTLKCDYWNSNVKLIDNGIARAVEVGERISFIIANKPSFWSLMQDFEWSDFQSEFIDWLYDNKELPSAINPFVGTFSDFLDQYISSTEGIILPFYQSNLALFEPVEGNGFLEDVANIYLKFDAEIEGNEVLGLGGHFCCYCKTIFEFIESKYSINLSVTDSELAYNIFFDEIASKMYIPLRNLSIQHTIDGFYFLFDNQSKMLPEDSTKDKPSKTLYDFTKTFFQHFNCLIDKEKNSDKYLIRRFDDIINSDIVELEIDKVLSYKPLIDGYNQNNWIKLSGIPKDGNILLGSKKITCKNKGLEVGKSDQSLFDIDAYIPNGIIYGGNTILNIAPAETIDQFLLFISNGQASTNVKSVQNGVTISESKVLQIASCYSIENEYNTLALMVEYPVFYTVQKPISINDIFGFQFFRRYFVRKLNGYFFINKIEGFNPDKSNEMTKLELIKIP